MLLAHALVFAAGAFALVLYVSSEDSYRRGGISRWEAYDAHVLTVGAIAAALGVAVLGGYGASRRSPDVAWTAGPAGVLAALLVLVAFLANSLN